MLTCAVHLLLFSLALPKLSSGSKFQLASPLDAYHVHECNAINDQDLLKVNELFVGTPWTTINSVATNIGFVSRHLRGVDLQHYRAPILTSESSRIHSWAFHPIKQRLFTVCDDSLSFYSIDEESRSAHSILKPRRSISGIHHHIAFNPVAACALVTGKYSVRVLDVETGSFSTGSCGLSGPPTQTDAARRGCKRKLAAGATGPTKPEPEAVKTVWNADNVTAFVSYADGNCKLFDVRAANNVLHEAAFHHLNRSKKPVTIVPLQHRPFFLSAGHFSACLEIKLWDQRYLTNDPLQLIDLGSTSSPICMVWDQETRHLFASPKGEKGLRHFSLYDADTHAPQLVLKDSFNTNTYIRNLAMIPISQWEHHRNETAQILLSDGRTINTLHVYEAKPDPEAALLHASPRRSQPKDFAPLTSSRELTASGSIAKPYPFSSAPEQFENSKYSFTCEDLLASQRKEIKTPRVPITAWAGLTSSIASEFLKSTYSDVNLVLPDNTVLPLHKCILAARSTYWRDNLSEHTKELKCSEMPIQGVIISPAIVEHMLFYIYTDTLPLLSIKSNPEASLALAYAWRLNDLVSFIEEWRLNPDRAKYFSFFPHHVYLLKSRPTDYFSDMKITSGTLATCGFDNPDQPLTLHTHRLFAATRNEFIRRTLLSGMHESKSGDVRLDLISSGALRLFVSHLYSNTLEGEDPERLMELWAVGDAYFMPKLIEACEMALRPLVDVNNCAQLYSRAGQSVTYLHTYIARFICSNYSSISEENKDLLDPALRQDIETNFIPVQSAVIIKSSAPSS